MARMIPPFVGDATKSDAERELFPVLASELDDSWTVFHSVGIAGHRRKPWAEADFVAVGPLGVFVLEVKGGRFRRDHGAWIYTNRGGADSPPHAESPFEQAGGAASALYAYLSEQLPAVRSAVVGHGVVTPDTTFTVSGPDITPALVYDSDDVALPFATYLERVAGFWNERLSAIKGRSPTTVDPALARDIVELIRPDFEVRLSLRARAARIDKELVRLTREQYAVLDGLAENDRAIISGGAGTGKTFLAVEEALRFARRGESTALVCFNRNLASYLSSAVSGEKGVHVFSFHAMAHDIVRRAGLEGELPDVSQSDLFEVYYPELAYRALVDELVPDRFDTIIIDEAQDLLSVADLDVFDALLAGGLSRGRWRIFIDPRQDIFEASQTGLLKKLRVGAASYSLAVNCRNTRPIAIETGLLCRRMPTETLVVEGPDVQRRWYEDASDQLRLLGRDITSLVGGGFALSDIVILGQRRLENSTLSGGIPHLAYRITDVVADRGVLRYCTVHAFKGLEADAILFVDLGDLESEAALRGIYIGASRARTDLFLYMSAQAQPQYEEAARALGRILADSPETSSASGLSPTGRRLP